MWFLWRGEETHLSTMLSVLTGFMLLENDFIAFVCVFTADVFTVVMISWTFLPSGRFYLGHIFLVDFFYSGHFFPRLLFPWIFLPLMLFPKSALTHASYGH